MIDLYQELMSVVDRLDCERIPYALVGGLAYTLYVEARATEDIDLLVRPQDWSRLPAALAPLGYLDVAGEMDFKNIRIRRLTKIIGTDAMVLDFLLADGGLQEGLEKAVSIALGDRAIRVAPAETIIELKKARLSAKDRNDIEGLQRYLEGQQDAER